MVFAVPFRMALTFCATHRDLLLICLRTQRSDRPPPLANQKKFLSHIYNYKFSGTPSLAGDIYPKNALGAVSK